MKMSVSELSPATVFWSQIETKIAKCDIGKAQHDPCLNLELSFAYFRFHSENYTFLRVISLYGRQKVLPISCKFQRK